MPKEQIPEEFTEELIDSALIRPLTKIFVE
jgi:hypothetical protein